MEPRGRMRNEIRINATLWKEVEIVETKFNTGILETQWTKVGIV